MVQIRNTVLHGLLMGALALGGCSSNSRVEYVEDGRGAGGAANTCAGQCVPLEPYHWFEPALLWMGDPSTAPACPEGAPLGEDVGFADLNVPSPCGTCACDPPSGSCTIPTIWTAHNKMACPAPPGSMSISFNAAAGWDGSCTTVNPIAAGKICNGVACVQSLSIAPLVLNEVACVSRVEPVLVPKNSAEPWGTLARVCRGLARGTCAAPLDRCTPRAASTNAAPTSDSFAQCVSREGDVECSGAYTVKHVFYKDFVDNRTCSPCACDAPTGSTCTATMNAYEDGACKKQLASNQIDATETACHDILPIGSALGSKSVEDLVYAPGACQASGGDTKGRVFPTPLCQRLVRQLFLEIYVPMGVEWIDDRAQAFPSSSSRKLT